MCPEPSPDPGTPASVQARPIDVRRVLLFLGISFGLSWALALVLYLTGGLAGSPPLLAGTPLTLAAVLLPVYMWMPAVGNVLTRLLTGEDRRDLYLRPRFRKGWPYWLAAWLLPTLFTLLGAALYFALAPDRFDPTFGLLRGQLEAAERSGQALPLSVEMLVVVQIVAAVFASPLLNSLFTFGEEFGWRAYLQPKLLPLGPRRAVLLVGVIWGVWHWPIIAMGHNYGTTYTGYPWLGLLLMVWFTIAVGIFLGWAALRAGSVWPAVIGHAVVNGVGGIGLLFLGEAPDPLVGPAPTGLIGSAAWGLAAAYLLWRLGRSGQEGVDGKW